MESGYQTYNSKEAKQIVESFLHCNLAKEKYTHAAHILTGFYLFCKHGKAANPIMEKHIIQFNNAVGTMNSDESGFHKTITFFWMSAIEQFSKTLDHLSFDDENIRHLYDSILMDKTLPMNFYSREYLFSKKARREIVEPDIQPILNIF